MNTVNIITLIAVILFTRLGLRLYSPYQKLKKEEKSKNIIEKLNEIITKD